MLFQEKQIGCFTVKMTIMLKNKILEKIQQSEGLTDKELFTGLSKDEVILESESVSYTHLTLPTILLV